MQNNCSYEGGIALCGTRGWIVPGTKNFSEHDEKIYKKELNRLKLSLTEALKDGYRKFIVTLHYLPFTPGERNRICRNHARL